MTASLANHHELQRLVQARQHAPADILGRHGSCIRVYLPHAQAAWLQPGGHAMQPLGEGLFEWQGNPSQYHRPYRIRWQDAKGDRHEYIDPYQFDCMLSLDELAEFNAGRHRRAHHLLGAHVVQRNGITGTDFAVWAPNAERVSVVGDFNQWDGHCHPMQARGETGVWELFIPDIAGDTLYKYEIRHRDSGRVLLKADPYARRYELRPRTASVVTPPSRFTWSDRHWLDKRSDWRYAPLSIYELHPGAWRRNEHGDFLNYRALADALIPYLQRTGFTHVELMPVMEHPLDESWGYQCTGYFAPTRRFGEPDDLRSFVNRLHNAGIGVILDWVPGHFPADEHALAQFDGTALYEHAEPQRAQTPDWGTLAFNFGRREVCSFLLSSAVYWLEDFHIDGLRVDAVAAMLYLDYGRQAGEWSPNIHGSHENLEAVAFLQALNTATHGECPGSFTIAEESTAWPGVSRPVWLGGLGFSMKWNMGWMHDTLNYLKHDPVHRRYHHNQLTFGMLYAYSENYVLPLSHDEVVHGKGSLYARMPGDDWRKHANLRLLFTYQFTYPGKKLLFMGGEFGAHEEWSPGKALDWQLAEAPRHRGLQSLIGDLNRLYRQHTALHAADFEADGFAWMDCHDSEQSIISYLRRAGEQCAIIVLNFTPLPRYAYRIGVPIPGYYHELLNSDADCYGGSNLGNQGGVNADAQSWMGQPYSLSLTLPPLGALILRPDQILR